jgi:hypothetical protein
MWNAAANAYAERAAHGVELDEADEELDVLHEQLTNEVAAGVMPSSVAAQVTLLSRVYERLGDHAVNLTRRIEMLPQQGAHHRLICLSAPATAGYWGARYGAGIAGEVKGSHLRAGRAGPLARTAPGPDRQRSHAVPDPIRTTSRGRWSLASGR